MKPDVVKDLLDEEMRILENFDNLSSREVLDLTNNPQLCGVFRIMLRCKLGERPLCQSCLKGLIQPGHEECGSCESFG